MITWLIGRGNVPLLFVPSETDLRKLARPNYDCAKMRLTVRSVFCIGALSFGSGLAYHVLFAAGPYQDPTPVMPHRYGA